MTIELTGFTFAGPGEPQPVGDGPRVTLVCDAGERTRTGECLRAVDAPRPLRPVYRNGKWRLNGDPAMVGGGWEARADPWGRTSRFTGRPIVLHLCPACARAQVGPANAEVAGTSESS